MAKNRDYKPEDILFPNQAIISNDQNKNKTYINDIPLGENEEDVLTNGCKVRMADTVIIYKEV